MISSMTDENEKPDDSLPPSVEEYLPQTDASAAEAVSPDVDVPTEMSAEAAEAVKDADDERRWDAGPFG